MPRPLGGVVYFDFPEIQTITRTWMQANEQGIFMAAVVLALMLASFITMGGQ